MTRPHVVALVTLARVGGAERSLLELVDRLRDAFRFTLVLPEEGPLAPAACAAGASVEIVPWPAALATAGERAGPIGLARLARAGAVVPRVVGELGRALAALAPDVLLTNGIKA